MQDYFEGRRELFNGLAADELEKDWISSPVIRLDMSTVRPTSVEGLKNLLGDVLCALEERFAGGRRLASTLGGRLAALIDCAAAGRKGSVVVLVDEYDAPLLNVIDDPGMLEAFRDIMREFYIPLKACDEQLRFVFLTGITKFSQLSIFSELNNLTNISMDPAYAGICGITADELDSEMGEDVEALAERLSVAPSVARQRLKDYYDGYHFTPDSPDIYNPFSLLSAFARGRIKSFWFGSGTPTAVIDAIRAHGWQIVDLTEVDALEAEFDAPTERSVAPTALLYQSGYLTVKVYDEEAGVYILGIPNVEVSRGLSESYPLPFLADGCAVIKVGVNFSPEMRTIDGWVIQGEPSRL